ncbi:MAG: hypothetical protein AAGI37_07935 [Planctomycetota bacterium]
MKFPKSEPYQRSRQRSALHALVFAATAVAAIGLPANAATPQRENTQQTDSDASLSSGDALAVASYWIDALYAGDTPAAMSMMHLPGRPDYQRAVQADLDVLSDLLHQQGVRAEPVAHRQAGHWALSAWQLDQPDVSLAPVLEPVTLYNPTADGLFESSADWQVMPQGIDDDAAFKPLYNTDYRALQAWYQTLL